MTNNPPIRAGRGQMVTLSDVQSFLHEWSYVSFFLVFGLVVLVLVFSNSAENKERTILLFPMPYKRVILAYSLVVVLLTAVSTIGLSNAVFERIFQKEEVGAFYEKGFYERDYEGLLFLNGRPIFCIVRVQHDIEELGYETHLPYSVYHLINPVQLPYGVKRYVEESSFDSFDKSFAVSFDREVKCKITLIRPVIYSSSPVSKI